MGGERNVPCGSLCDRLHLPADRNIRRRLVVRDDDVVLVTVLESPLAADQGCACDVGAREGRKPQALAPDRRRQILAASVRQCLHGSAGGWLLYRNGIRWRHGVPPDLLRGL